MKSIALLFLTKIFSLIGASLNTVGFLTFFFWESLEPYRWKMIIGGLLLIAVSELIGYLLAKKMAEGVELDDSTEKNEL